jgi:hypothetical protein
MIARCGYSGHHISLADLFPLFGLVCPHYTKLDTNHRSQS